MSKSETMQFSMTEFINQLQDQIRRINNVFSFKYSSDPPLTQALSYITQSIDSILEEKYKTSHDQTYNSSYSDSVADKNYQKLKEELDKARETSKNLNRYEQLLKKKEEKLESEKKQVKSMKKNLEKAEEDLIKIKTKSEQEEKIFIQSQKDLKTKLDLEREDLDRKLIEIKDMREKFETKMEETTKHLKYEKESLVHLESVLKETKSNLIVEQKNLSSYKIELEKFKWEIEQKERKVEESKILLNVKLEKLSEEVKALEIEKQKVLDSWARLERERTDLKGIQIGQSKDSKGSSFRNFENEAKEEEKEIEIGMACEELESQIDKINKDFESRESGLDDRERSLNRTERDIQLKFENFRKIESSLTESKIYSEQLKDRIFPELEDQAKHLEALIKETNQKKRELEISIIKVNKEIEFIQRYKARLDSLYVSDKNDESEKLGKTTSLGLLTQELEEKILVFSRKTQELELEEDGLENERMENVKNAEFLKKAHKEVENARSAIQETMAGFEEKERKLNEMQVELERREKELGERAYWN